MSDILESSFMAFWHSPSLKKQPCLGSKRVGRQRWKRILSQGLGGFDGRGRLSLGVGRGLSCLWVGLARCYLAAGFSCHLVRRPITIRFTWNLRLLPANQLRSTNEGVACGFTIRLEPHSAFSIGQERLLEFHSNNQATAVNVNIIVAG